MDDLAENMRQRIASRLAKLGLTPLTAATKAELPRDTIRNLFRQDGSLPRADTLVRIAAALETTVGYLVGENAYDGSDYSADDVRKYAEMSVEVSKKIKVRFTAGGRTFAQGEELPSNDQKPNIERDDYIYLNVPGYEADDLFAVQVADESMNYYYELNRFLICGAAEAVGLRAGDHVVFMGMVDGRYTCIVRQLALIKRENVPGFVAGLVAASRSPGEYPDIILDEPGGPRGRIIGVVVADIAFHDRPAAMARFSHILNEPWFKEGEKATG